MESWPRDYGAHPTADREQRQSGWHIPERGLGTLDITGGRIGGATLIPDHESQDSVEGGKGGKLKWSFARIGNKGFPKVAVIQDRVEAFPPTKPPRMAQAKQSVNRLAELGTEYLRTAYPDLDVPGEVIQTEYQHLDDIQKAHDPSMGKLLGVLEASDTEEISSTRFTVFPTGELGCELNLSPLVSSEDEDGGNILTFAPSANPATAFDTPIKQIEARPHLSSQSFQTPGPISLISRTYGKTTFMKVHTTSPFLTTSSSISSSPTRQSQARIRAMVTPIAAIDSSNTGGTPILDLALDEPGVRVLSVNSQGEVFEATFRDNGALKCDEVFKKGTPNATGVLEDEGSWKVKWTTGHMDGLLASNRMLSGIDLRSPDITSQWRPLKAGGTILDIEGASSSRPGSLACVTTTTSLLWLDERNYKEPLFVKRHFRVRDWSLRTDLGGRGAGGYPLTLLSSANNSLITVYDVSRDNTNDDGNSLIHTWSDAYTLPLNSARSRNVFSPRHRRVGLQVVPKSIAGGENTDEFCVFELSERGALYMSEFAIPSTPAGAQDGITTAMAMDVDRGPPVAVKFSAGMKNLQNTARSLSRQAEREEEDGMKQLTPFEEAAERIYNDLFEKPDGDQEYVPNSTMEETYELLERMKEFPKYSQAPLENALTLGEIASLCGDDPPQPAHIQKQRRSALFSRNPLDTKQGRYVAFNNRLPVQEIADRTSWRKINLVETLSVLNEDFPPFLKESDPSNDVASLIEFIQKFDPTSSETKEGEAGSEHVLPRAAIRRQTEAAEALALDLILSSTVFVPPADDAHAGPSDGPSGVGKESADVGSSTRDTSGLEGATAALSLKPSGPPGFTFRYLRPIGRNVGEDGDDDEYEDPEDVGPLLPPGVQYLLDEWKLGEQPSDYVYSDPYAVEEEVTESVPPGKGKGKERGRNDWDDSTHHELPMTKLPPTIAVKAKAPPTILSASQPNVGRPTVRFSSPVYMTQPTGFPASQPSFPQSSQELEAMPSTQLVPGRFGGKLTSGKKPIKKRMGGF